METYLFAKKSCVRGFIPSPSVKVPGSITSLSPSMAEANAVAIPMVATGTKQSANSVEPMYLVVKPPGQAVQDPVSAKG